MTLILGKSVATAEQLSSYLLSVNKTPKFSRNISVKEFCQLYIDIGNKEGVRGDLACVQCFKETDYLKYGGDVLYTQNNFAGLGTTGNGVKGCIFPDIETGILAHIQHLKTYATKSALNEPCVDPRRTAWFVNAKGGTSPTIEGLGGTWAVPGYDTKKYKSLNEANKAKDSYGYQIVNILNKVLKIDIKEENKMAYKIATDAGHGSATAGKRTPSGWREHWTNVKCANYFDIAMKRCGFEMVKIAWDDTISTDDSDISLSQRQNLIKVAGCDASVSWHANAHGDGKTYNTGQGIETLIHSYSSRVGDSRNLANKVQAHLIQGTSQKNRGVKTSNLAMCNCQAMGTKASILIEIGFMTNAYESELIQSDAFCFECAEEATKGFCEYFGVKYISPSATVKPSATTTRSYLMKGDKGTEVKELQIDLNYLGYNCGTADGDFGTKTDTALRNFQKDYKLTVDGKYGANSKKVLEDAVAKKKVASTTTSAKPIISVSGGKYIYNGIDYSLVFNPTYYTNKYSDLKNAFGTNATKLFEHYITYGMKEGRRACGSFDVKVYKANNADLQKAFGDDYVKYFQHYLTYGHKENRKVV